MAITCPVNDSTGLCSTLESTGAGLGIFLQYLGQALPIFLLILVVVGGVGVLFYAIAQVISKSVSRVRMK